MQKKDEGISKQNSINKLTLILLCSFVAICVLGFTFAWFTDLDNLIGSGTTPNASVHLYVNGSETTTADIYNQTVNSTTSISKSVQFDCSGSNIDLLAVAHVTVGFVDTNSGEPEPLNSWASLNINTSSSWILGDDGAYYYASKILKSNVSNKITIFDTITFDDNYALYYVDKMNLVINVYVEVVQANKTGLDKLKENGNAILPASFESLV